MKINRKLIAALAMVSVAFTACQEPEEFHGLNVTAAAPSAVTYDDNGSGDTTIAVYWDAKDAIAAGATSFTLQLLSKAADNPDPYSANKNILVTTNYEGSPAVTEGDAACDQYVFTGLAKGKSHWVRIRANYPNSVFSDWVYLLDKTGTAPARIKVGLGLYDPNAPLTASATAGIGFAWIIIDKQDDCTYEVYNGSTKLESAITKTTDTEDTICATGLELGKDFNLTLKVIDNISGDVREVNNITGTSGNIKQLKENVGPTHVSVGWTEVPAVNGNLKRAYSGQLATDKEMKNLVYDIDFRDAMTDNCGAFNSSSWYGKKDGTNLNIPTAATFGQLKANTKYYFRVKTTEKNSDGVALANPMGNSLWSPVVELTTEDVHKPAANEVIFQGFDDITLQSDFINYAAGTTPNVTDKKSVTNPWPYSDAAHWNLYNSTNSHLLGTWGYAAKGKFIDGQTKHTSEIDNYIGTEKAGSLAGWHMSDSISPHQGYVKMGAGSETYNYISTPALDSPLLSAAGTPCIVSFKACAVVTDLPKVTIEHGRAGVYEEFVKFDLPRACSEYIDGSNYVYDGKWTTYSAEIVLKPGDNIAIRCREKRFVIDDILIVTK